MEITKWLPGSICAALLAVSGATSLQLARGAAQREAQLQSTTITISEKPLCSNLAPSAPVSSDIDATVKRYYFDHISEFAPLPASPMQRVAAFRQIESQIRQKLGILRKS
jgi:hypothetical protein